MTDVLIEIIVHMIRETHYEVSLSTQDGVLFFPFFIAKSHAEIKTIGALCIFVRPFIEITRTHVNIRWFSDAIIVAVASI